MIDHLADTYTRANGELLNVLIKRIPNDCVARLIGPDRGLSPPPRAITSWL